MNKLTWSTLDEIYVRLPIEDVDLERVAYELGIKRRSLQSYLYRLRKENLAVHGAGRWMPKLRRQEEGEF